MRNQIEPQPIVCNIKCKNFEGCNNKVSENYAKSFNGYCPTCALKRMFPGMTLDELDEIKTKQRKSNRVI